MCLILFAIAICVICFAMEWYLVGTIILILMIIGAIFFISITQNEKEMKKQEEEKERRLQERRNEEYAAYLEVKHGIIEKYGEPTKTIYLCDNNEIMVFDKAKRIWICGKDVAMEDILECNLNDMEIVKKGRVTATAKTDTGNMAKRAVVGGVLLGGAGAVIGGSTAKKDVIIHQSDDKISHYYTVSINVNSLSEPIIEIVIDNDLSKANEVVGLMNVIIKNNQKL